MHVTWLPLKQLPNWQVSFWVHPLPSLQAAPFGLLGLEHTPVLGLHMPALWHVSSAEQMTGLAPVQFPFWQVSAWVQAFESLQAAPLALLGLEHTPVLVSQVPGSWHWSGAAHIT